MLQATAAAPDRTVQKAVGLMGSRGEIRDDVDAVLGVAGLARKAGSLVSQLSGGEKRRLGFATAVYGGPELVVLDDPTTGLDSHSRDALWDVLRRLRDDGSTVLLTTHHPDEVQQRADRIGLLHEGTLRSEGTVAQLMPSRPSTSSSTCTGCWSGRTTTVCSCSSCGPTRPASTTSSAAQTPPDDTPTAEPSRERCDMNAIDRAVDDLHELVAQGPEIVRPVIQRATVTRSESAATLAAWAALTSAFGP
jgi:energy-coupling factor transporter ATP-binding protein EcfA2